MNTDMTLIKGAKFLTLSLSLLTTNAFAIPDHNQNISGLTSKISLDGVGTLLGDDKNRKIVYVQPGSKKFNGKFYLTNGGIDCQDLFNLRKMTYRMPTEELFSTVIDSNISYSPGFESSVGVSAKNIGLSKKIIDAKFKVTKYIDQHQSEYGAYASTNAALNIEKGNVESIKVQIEDLNSSLSLKIGLATSEEERNSIRTEYKKEALALQYKLSKANHRKSIASQKYLIALRAWAPFNDQLTWLTNIESNLSISFDRIQELADQSLARSEKLIQSLEQKTVGYASTSYSLNVEPEISILNKRMNDAGVRDYSLTPLTVFNVKLNPGVTKKVNSLNDASIGADYQMITYNFPYDTKMQLGTASKFIDFKGAVKLQQGSEKPKDLRFLMADLNGSFGGSQSFEIPVTQGAICGYAISKQVHYNYSDTAGNRMSRTVNRTTYNSPAPNQPVFVQNVALRYNYYERADRIEGNCKLDVRKTSSFVRNSGRKTSWSWFKKSTHTWDDTRKSMSEKRGIDCHLTKSPAGANPEESKEINNAFEKALYQDMFGLFLTSYAKDFSVKPIKPELLSADSRFFSKIGSGVMNLCGSNMYCQIGGIILKSMDELVGARHTGSTSNTTSMTGTLTKDFSLDTYMISEGFSNIEMRVCLDHTKCEE